MVDAVVKDQAIWIIHPVFGWSVMILRAILLLIILGRHHLQQKEAQNLGSAKAGSHDGKSDG
jgi:uncharacterized membrane protein